MSANEAYRASRDQLLGRVRRLEFFELRGRENDFVDAGAAIDTEYRDDQFPTRKT